MNEARRRRLIRLRTTAPPTRAGTARPSRGGPEGSWPGATKRVPHRVLVRRPSRRTLSKSRLEDREEGRFMVVGELRGEPSSALVPTRLQDRAAGTGLHAGPEAVLTLTATVVGLIRPLGHWVSSDPS